MKPKIWMWVFLVVMLLVPWRRYDATIEAAVDRLMPWIGVGMVVMFVLNYLDVTFRRQR